MVEDCSHHAPDGVPGLKGLRDHLAGEVGQPFDAELPALWGSCVDNAVGVEEHAVAGLECLGGNGRLVGPEAPRQRRSTMELVDDPVVPDEEGEWVTSIDPVQRARPALEPSKLPGGEGLSPNRALKVASRPACMCPSVDPSRRAWR